MLTSETTRVPLNPVIGHSSIMQNSSSDSFLQEGRQARQKKLFVIQTIMVLTM